MHPTVITALQSVTITEKEFKKCRSNKQLERLIEQKMSMGVTYTGIKISKATIGVKPGRKIELYFKPKNIIYSEL